MLGFSWCGAGSNRRHKDFQSFALPTELPHRFFEIPNSNRAANIGRIVKKTEGECLLIVIWNLIFGILNPTFHTHSKT